jgi:hypothetical protein
MIPTTSKLRQGIRAGPRWLGCIGAEYVDADPACCCADDGDDDDGDGAADPDVDRRRLASYTARRAGSPSTRYASLIDGIEIEPAAEPADACRSGWCSRASRR